MEDDRISAFKILGAVFILAGSFFVAKLLGNTFGLLLGVIAVGVFAWYVIKKGRNLY